MSSSRMILSVLTDFLSLSFSFGPFSNPRPLPFFFKRANVERQLIFCSKPHRSTVKNFGSLSNNSKRLFIGQEGKYSGCRNPFGIQSANPGNILVVFDKVRTERHP